MNAIAFEINGKGTVFILYTQTLMNKIPFFSEESIPFYAAKNLRHGRGFVPKIGDSGEGKGICNTREV